MKPECEKSRWEKFKDGCKKVGEWCKEHWKEILITVTIVIGAVLAIVAVVATGGMALVPLLTTMLTTFGVSAGLATTIATITSLSVATIAILSTLGSSTLNIIDTWGNIDNSEFRSAIYGARNYNFVLSPNTSTFWAGLGKDGADVAKSFANTNGRTTLEKTIEELGINMPE